MTPDFAIGSKVIARYWSNSAIPQQIVKMAVNNDSNWSNWYLEHCGRIFTVTGYGGGPGIISPSLYANWIQIEASDGKAVSTSIHPSWLAPCTPRKVISKCSCVLSRGCICGVFESEMKARGKVYNSVYKHWTTPRKHRVIR